MEKLSIGFLFIMTMAVACSSQTNSKRPEDKQQTSTLKNVEMKTNTSSSAAKVSEQSDSAILIRPIHKYKHQKKIN
jgi:hypothetical protein